jgi:hypothetical protein
MSQISRPIQILLGAVIVFGIAWFLFLKPGDDETVADTPAPTTAQAPGVKGLTTATKKAEAAKAMADKRSTEAAKATGTETTATKPSSTATKPPTSTQAAVTPAGPPVKDPARNSGDPADGLLDELTGDRVVVLLFAGEGADDRVAIRAVRAAGNESKNTIVRVTQIRNVGKYATITDKLGITEAPSTIIIGSDKVAQVLTGLIDSKVVKQYIGDARRRAAKNN